MTVAETKYVTDVTEYEPTDEPVPEQTYCPRYVTDPSEYEPPTDEEVQAFLEEERDRRRQVRLDSCGIWAHFFNRHTGRKETRAFTCRMFRECESCRKHRGAKEKFMFEKFADRGVIAVRVSQDAADKIIRKVSKQDFRRLPQDDHDLLFLRAKKVNLKPDIEYEKVGFKWRNSTDWSELMNTPEGRNISGNLHCPKNEHKGPLRFALIPLQQMVTDAPYKVIGQAMDEAIEETPGLLPQDRKQTIEALRKRIDLAVKKIKAVGFDVEVYTKTVKLKFAMLDWS